MATVRVPAPTAKEAPKPKVPEWLVQVDKLVNLHVDRNVCYRSVKVLAVDPSGLYVQMDPVHPPFTETAFFPWTAIQGVGVVAARP